MCSGIGRLLICSYSQSLKERKNDDPGKQFFYISSYSVSVMHIQEIYHRDLKPQNILMDPGNTFLKICDFGFSKVSKNVENAHLVDVFAFNTPKYCIHEYSVV